MISKIYLDKSFFSAMPRTIIDNSEFQVNLFKYPSGIEAVEIVNSRGSVTVLPYMGQMIWDLKFDNIDLKMKNMFSQPKPAECVIDTYGCFAFHAGLLANGCPAPADNHPLHGEMPCAAMDSAWLEVGDQHIAITGSVEYVQGFGHHYNAVPRVSLGAGATQIDITMRVKNLATVPMPLQYMCHMNYAYVPNGEISSNLPATAFALRETIPAHVKPTKQWLEFNEAIKVKQKIGESLVRLDNAAMYDPEIVFMADAINQYGEKAEFTITSPDGYSFSTEFLTKEFPSATRWLLYNGDQQVAAFVLPGTCRPEGFLAAKQAGTLIMLEAGEERSFHVKTGKK